MKVTVRQMQVFDAVATLGSVTAAATRLNMSQSAASGALADMQVVLRRSLFARVKGRPLQLTDEGRRLQPLIRSLLSGIEDLEQADDAAPLSGKLVIGATATVAETVLPRLCIEFMELHPEVRIKVECEAAADLLARLRRFELETALIEVFPDVEGIELTRWRTDELLLVAAADHPLAGRAALRLSDLGGYGWCTREGNSSITARLRYLLHQQLGQLPVAFESTSNWAVRHAVLAGGGIGCLSRALVQFDLDNGRLSQLDVPEFQFTRALSLARPKDIGRTRLAQTFDEFLLARGNDPA